MGTRRHIGHPSHWGAFTAAVEDGRLVGVEPFAGDPDSLPGTIAGFGAACVNGNPNVLTEERGTASRAQRPVGQPCLVRVQRFIGEAPPPGQPNITTTKEDL